MSTREIQPAQWKPFLEDFSRRHQGVLMAIETADPDAGPQEEINALPFVGISYEEKGSDADSVEVSAGTEPERHMTHVIFRPRAIYHKEGAGLISDEVNRDEILEITSADEPPVTYLRFLH
ncbi:MAG TPA: DUF5335 family protein [Capsulimonadaceae bacterium]|nr:DUF5335 family protein [Capsulimonadaceae bacterium]